MIGGYRRWTRADRCRKRVGQRKLAGERIENGRTFQVAHTVEKKAESSFFLSFTVEIVSELSVRPMNGNHLKRYDMSLLKLLHNLLGDCRNRSISVMESYVGEKAAHLVRRRLTQWYGSMKSFRHLRVLGVQIWMAARYKWGPRNVILKHTQKMCIPPEIVHT